MDFAVQVVPDDALPRDVQQVMVERRGKVPLLLIAESVAGVYSFVSDWADDHEAAATSLSGRGRMAAGALCAVAAV